jgi:hypothetical protein
MVCGGYSFTGLSILFDAGAVAVFGPGTKNP